MPKKKAKAKKPTPKGDDIKLVVKGTFLEVIRASVGKGKK